MAMNVSATFNLDLGQALSQTRKLRDNMEGAADASDRLNRSRGGVRDLARGGGGGGGGGGGPDTPSSTREYRSNRGAAGLRGSATRDFAALSQAGNTSGVVAAYATLMAQVFALTSAFQALSNAAKTIQLEKGLEAVGAMSGRTLKPLARDLREVTGYALNTAQSLRTVASATASNFGGKEINALGRIAKGASIALGRDMTDSMDRLIRGAIKLEPELLDELGIMTRLSDATKTYALENGKTVSSLTQVERQMAFTNAIIEEGGRKFGAIADSVPSSSFDKFTAVITDLGTNLLNIINFVFSPLLDLMIKFPQVVLIAVGSIGAAVLSKLMPDIDNLANASQGKIDAIQKRLARVKQLQLAQATARAGNVERPQPETLSYMESRGFTFSTGKNADKDLTELKKKAQQSLANLQKRENDLVAKGTAGREKELETLRKAIGFRQQALRVAESEERINVQMLRTRSASLVVEGQLAATKNQQGVAEEFDTNLAGSRGVIDTIGITAKGMRDAISTASKDAANQVSIATEGTTGLSKALAFLRGSWSAAGRSAAGFGTAASMAFKGILASLGPITAFLATVMTLFQIGVSLSDWITGNTEERKKAKQDLDDIYKSVDTIAKQVKQFREDNNFGSAIDAAVNSTIELRDAWLALMSVETPKPFDEFAMAIDNFFGRSDRTPAKILQDAFESNVSKFDEDSAKVIRGYAKNANAFGADAGINFQLGFNQAFSTGGIAAAAKYSVEFAENLRPIQNAFGNIQTSAKNMEKTISGIRTPSFFKTPMDPFIDDFNNILTTVKKLEETVPKITGANYNDSKRSIVDSLLGSPTALTEIGRVTGDTDKLLAAQTKIEQLKREEKLNENGNYETKKRISDEMKTQVDILYDIINETTLRSLVDDKISLVTKQTNLELAKQKETYADINANIQRQLSSISKMKRDIDNLNKYGRKDFGPIFSGIEAVNNAREVKKLAESTAEAKLEVIRQEAALLKLQNERDQGVRKAQMSVDFGGIDVDAFMGPAGAAKDAAMQKFKDLDAGQQANFTSQTNVLGIYKLINDQIDANTTARMRLMRVENQGLGVSVDLANAELDASIRNINNLETQIALTQTLNDLRNQRAESLLDREQISLDNARTTAEREAASRGEELSRQQVIDFDTAQLRLDGTKLLKELFSDLPNQKAQLKKQFDKDALKRNEDFNVSVSKLFSSITQKSTSADIAAVFAQFDNLTKAFNTTEANNLAVYNQQLTNINEQAANAGLKFEGLTGTLKGTISAVDEMDIKFRKKLADTKRTGELTSDPLGSLLSGMGFSFGENLVSARQQIISETDGGISAFQGEGGEQMLQRMAFALAEQTTQANLLNDAMQQVGASAAQAFSIMISSPKDAQQAFRDFIISTLSMIAQLLIQMAIMAAFKAIIDPAGTAAGAAAAPGIIGGGIASAVAAGIAGIGSVPKPPEKGAAGGVMSRSKGLQGIVSSPTYLVGEGKYNEAVVPLPNGRDIPVQLHGTNSGTNNVSVNVNMANGSSNTQMSGNDGANLGAAIARAVQKELLAQKAPGGILNKYGVA